MGLLEIDTEGVSGVEFEGYAPRAVHMDRVTRGNEAFESMEIKARKVHLSRCCYNIQAIKAGKSEPDEDLHWMSPPRRQMLH